MKMLKLNDYQNELASKIKLLKEASGSHSPSINTIREKFTDLEIKVGQVVGYSITK